MKKFFKCSFVALVLLICSSFSSNNQMEGSSAGTGNLSVELDGPGSLCVNYSRGESIVARLVSYSTIIENIPVGNVCTINPNEGYYIESFSGNTTIYEGETSYVYVRLGATNTEQ